MDGGLKSMTNSLKKSYVYPWNWLGAIFGLGSVQSLKKTFDYRNNAGAIVLGLNKPAVKTHGNADAKQFYSAIRALYGLIESNLTDLIKKEMSK